MSGLPTGREEAPPQPRDRGAAPELPGFREVTASVVSTSELAPGSEEAQKRQLDYAAQQQLPLEVENTIGMRFRVIPPGEFSMGSPDSEPGRVPLEGPQHRVQIANAFYAGVHEVTQGQWETVMGDTPSHFKEAGKGAPVEWVSWNDCQAFVANLCRKEGVPSGTYRLLTEAEWEYACRAGTTSAFYGGEIKDLGGKDPVLDRVAWFVHSSGGTTHPVGQKDPNAWGLYDMHGNVWEWCEDDWHDSYSGAPADGKAWVDSPRGSTRVDRGGSYGSRAWSCRSAYRLGDWPGNGFDYLGFRLARQLPAAVPPTADYRIIELGTLDGDSISGSSIGTLGGRRSMVVATNNLGQIAGTACTAEIGPEGMEYRHAFLCQDCVMTDLGTLGGPNGHASGLNQAGQIVGRAETSDGEEHAFLWQDGVATDLGTLGGSTSTVTKGLAGIFAAINEAGQIVGTAYIAEDDEDDAHSSIGRDKRGHAFLWQDGVMTDLGTLGGRWSMASGINELGQVIGSAETAETYVRDPFFVSLGVVTYEIHAFVWQDGVMTDLGTLGGHLSEAYEINERGQIVGRAQTDEKDDIGVHKWRAVLWDPRP